MTDGETQENLAPKTAAKTVYTDDTLSTTVRQALLEKTSIGTYTHTYDSDNKTHDLVGEGTVGWMRVTAPYSPGDTFTINGEPMDTYAQHHDPQLKCFTPGRMVIFTRSGEAIDFQTCGTQINVRDVELYGVRVDKTNPDPSTRCTYLFDAVGKRPARMVYGAGSYFDYGDWRNVGFVRDNRPVMLRSNGTVAYALDPANLALKEDGGASDIANIAFDGNAMSEMPQWWLKQYEDESYQYILLSNIQFDEDFYAYAFTREDGSIADCLYLPMYRGSYSGDKLRSLSGQPVMVSKFVYEEVAYAAANGGCWGLKSWAQVDYVNALLTLISCSTDSQTVFGKGRCGSNARLTTGTLNAAGQFFGYNNDDEARVKVFFCEDWWGNAWDHIVGLIIQNGRFFVKMTPPYSVYSPFRSGISDLNAWNFIDTGISPIGSGEYITEMNFSRLGKIPSAMGSDGSSTTYYPDTLEYWQNNSGTYIASVSGYSFCGTRGGSFHLEMRSAFNVTGGAESSSLSALP